MSNEMKYVVPSIIYLYIWTPNFLVVVFQGFPSQSSSHIRCTRYTALTRSNSTEYQAYSKERISCSCTNHQLVSMSRRNVRRYIIENRSEHQISTFLLKLRVHSENFCVELMKLSQSIIEHPMTYSITKV